jgi:hypothetical protein
VKRVPVSIGRSSLPLFPKEVAATVIRRRQILIRHDVPVTISLLAHELCHVIQAETRPWPLAYILQWIMGGFRYHSMPFEIEARKAESNPWFRAWARDLLAKN